MSDFVVAVTGGIASGKTEACRRFEALGRPVADADVIARDIVEPGQPALAEIVARFGPTCLQGDGRLDRGWLRAHVFNDADGRRDLEAILHPRIRAGLRAAAQAATAPYVLVAIPLLAEGGGRTAYPWLHRILVVDVPRELQLRRLTDRDGGSLDLAERMLAAQVGRAERLALADDVIVNNGPLAALATAVAALDVHYLALARRGAGHV